MRSRDLTNGWQSTSWHSRTNEITIASNGAGGRVGLEIETSRAGPLMRVVIRTELCHHETTDGTTSRKMIGRDSQIAGDLAK